MPAAPRDVASRSSVGSSGAASPATSIVLITRNQAWNVDAAITAAICELERAGGGEIIVVDSASSDGTLDRAGRYPVGLVELLDDQTLTPALGRWVGGGLARGEAVLFLDGDMRLTAGWLECARAVLEEADDVACVSGPLVYTDSMHAQPGCGLGEREAPWFNGAALIRRAALARSGSFNPVLRSEEESELSTRIRALGYRIVLLERPIATHPSSAVDSLRDVLARRRRGLYLGFGQVLKLHIMAPSRSEYLRERAFWLPPAAAVIGVGIAAASAYRRRSVLPVVGVCACAVLLGLSLVKRKGGIAPAVAGLTSRAAILEGTVRGLALRARPPAHLIPSVGVHREPPLIEIRP
jgi:hypothetical protein